MPTTITTSQTTLAKLGKKMQGQALKGFANRNEMWKRFRDLKDFEMQASQREVTTIIDIVEQPSGAFISEAGYEANAKTIDPQDLSFTWAFYNDRFSFSRTNFHLDRRFRNAQLLRQSVYQTKKLMEGLVRRVGIGAFGVSTGELAQTSTAATQSSGTYALKNGFGQANIDTTAYLAQLFKVGDYVALVRSGALVTNAIGVITAVSTSSGITVTWAGSVTSQDNDSIVLANAYPTSALLTLAGGTEYNKAPIGLLEMATATSLHGLSSSSYPLWAVAYTDTTAGYLTGTMVKRWQHEIKNKGGGDLTDVILAQGVERGLHQTTSAAVQFNDPLNMNIVGDVKAKGVKMVSDPLCPNGYAFAMDRSSFYKWSITEFPTGDETNIEGDEAVTVDKQQDVSGSVLSFDLLYQFVCKNRGNLVVATSLTEA